ncbi:MAG: transporter substrate-binding domain-containing protein [Flavobacteriales bacterium]
MKRITGILLIFLFIVGTLNSQQSSKPKDTVTDSKKLIVGIKHSPPFIIPEGKGYSGVSAELWMSITRELEWEYEFKKFETLTQLLSAVENNKVDICINPLTISSERNEKMRFTHPFYISNLTVATQKKDETGLFSYISNIFSWSFFKAIIVLFMVIFIFGLILWLVEKKANPDHFDSGLKGVWHGFWWSAVTMTTVGYGDKSPITNVGRAIAIIWMFTALIMTSSLTASIASSLTIQKSNELINELNDLKNINTGTVKKSNSENYLKKHKIFPSTYSSHDKAIQDLANKKLKAFVYDEPLVRYHINSNNMSNKIKILNISFDKQLYSFAAPKNSSLIPKINKHLLRIIESQEWENILQQYELNK